MKKIIATVLASMMLAMPVMSMAESAVITPTAEITEQASVISVQGSASITVEPDQAELSFGAEFIEEDAQTAQGKVNDAINAAVEALKKLGIDEKAIQTDSISIYRQYDYSGDTPVVTGFSASTQLRVSLSDISLAGAAIDAGINAGLNSVNDITFSSSKQAEYYDQVLAEAVKSARHKAEIMAAAEGGTISRLISANEGYSGSMYSRTNSVQYSVAEDAGYGSTNISAGEIEITANINATYEMVQD